MEGPAIVLGIDEAGRGAHIGPLVVAGVALGPQALQQLARVDLRDSKGMTTARRLRLLALIRDCATWIGTEVRDARVVDRYVAGTRTNLNVLERRMAAILIRSAPTGARVIADGRAIFSPLQRRFPTLVAENHADEHHPAVMAAALLAKAERDRLLEQIDRACGSLCGCIPRKGYPGASTTAWLARYERFFGNLPLQVRRTWRQPAAQPAPATPSP